MKSPTKSKRHRFYALFRREREVGQLLVRNPLTRRLRIEQLEDRRMLASHTPLVGVDFDNVSDNAPTGWEGVDSFSNGLRILTDIGGTKVDLELKETGPNDFSPQLINAETIPFESSIDNLKKLDGWVAMGSNDGLTATWRDLKPGFTYQVYVFSLFVTSPRIPNIITISGGNPDISFSQEGESKDDLVVNDETGKSSKSLSEFAKLMRADATGSIIVTVRNQLTNLSTPLAGLAIREHGIVVNHLGPFDDGDPNDAVTTLREAINLANANPGPDIIFFDETVLDGREAITLGGTELRITDELTIDASLLDQNVTIDAQGQSRGFQINAAAEELFVLDSVNITGTITTGNNPDNNGNIGTEFNGAAISYRVTNSSPSNASASTGEVGAGMGAATGGLHIRNSLITGNITTGLGAAGGAIFSTGDVTIINSTISGNRTEGDFAYGGALSVLGQLTVIGSTIEDNYTSGANARGGAIDVNGDATFTDSTVRNNYTLGNYSSGGGISNGGVSSAGTINLARTTISGNWTMGSGSSGGGIDSVGYLTINGSRIVENNTYGYGAGGGGIRASISATINDSTISGNSTSGNQAGGGGISSSGRLTVSNSTISGNSVQGTNSDGGGIATGGYATFITQSTITDNHATGSGSRGGGVRFFLNDVMLNGSILAANTAVAMGPDSYTFLGGGTLSTDYSLIGDAVGAAIPGTGSIIGDSTGAGIVDPQLGPLANNGGPTQTHALLPGSPAIDAGSSDAGSSPTALFRFEGDATDSMGTNNGTLQGGLLADDPGAPNISPTGVQFEDIETQFITLASPLTIGSTSSTIEAWVNIPTDADEFLALLSNFDFATGSTFWGIDPSGVPRINWNNFEVVLNGTTDLRDGQWHLLSFVRDTVANEIRIYVDGIEDAMFPSAGSNVTLTPTYRIGNSPGGTDPWEGTLDELAIFDRALSPDEIRMRAGIFDQRGFAFDRVINERMDIGAFEFGAKSADFDGDGDVDGYDFLRWQQGLGTSPAALHEDGDADVNGIVDGADELVWELQYGSTAVLGAMIDDTVAASMAEAPTADLRESTAANRQYPLSTELVDLALALIDEGPLMFGRNGSIVEDSESYSARRVAPLANPVSIKPNHHSSQEVTDATRSTTAENEHEQERLTPMDEGLEKLFDRVFG